MAHEDTETLRRRRENPTREGILDALAETIDRQGLHDFSVQDVADRAGVSHRTVYRYFPSRKALLNGLALKLDELFRERGLPVLPESSHDIPVQLRTAFEVFGERPNLTRAVVVGALSTGTQPDVREERDRVFRERIEEAAGDLPHAEVRGASAVIRYLANSLAWVVLTDQLGLDEDEVGDAAAWAVETLLEDVRRRGRASIEASPAETSGTRVPDPEEGET